jgi:hypothetical protein
MSARWHEFLPAIAVPKGIAGYLDWSTGILRVNAPYDVWERISTASDLNKLKDWERDVVETVTHETIHFLQITTTGYLYSFAIELLQLIKACISFPVKDFSQIPSVAPPQQAERIRNHLTCLDLEGVHSITVRSIVECQALLGQLRTHWRGLTHQGFLQRVHEAHVPKEYRLAYLAATHYLGENAFEGYPFVSSMALCTRDPVASFDVICRAVRTRALPAKPREALQGYLELLNDLHGNRELELTGTAREIINDLPEHPVYTPMVVRLNEMCEEKHISMLDYMAAPHEVSEPIAVAVARPTVFNADHENNWYVHVPTNWRPDLTKSAKDEEAEALIFLMSVATKLLRSI